MSEREFVVINEEAARTAQNMMSFTVTYVEAV